VTTQGKDGGMADVAVGSTAMLIVRAWREDGPFRATIASSLDVVTSSPTEHGVASTREDVLEQVDRWLGLI
jgi:hypothetical protein